MRAYWVASCALWTASLAVGQHHKLSIDPETKEGYVLQLIQQERDPLQKIKLMNEFVVEFPKSTSLPWVYDQLQPVYLEAKDYDKVIAIGAKMLEADADDLEAPHNALIAAENLKDTEQVKKFAAATWTAAARLEKTPGYAKAEYARQLMAYAEYSVAALANHENDAHKRQEYMKVLEGINPSSQWLHTSRNDFFTLTQQGVGAEKLAAAAAKALVTNPDNEDMLLAVADYYMQSGIKPDKVVEYSARIIEILRTKHAPEKMTAAAWEKKKERYLGAAHYMLGVLLSIQGRYSDADRNLRAALPVIRNGSDQALGATLYHLGYANYQLAEKGERHRVFDALKFNEQCATTHSTYSDQARKNIDAIKSEYNLR